MKITNESHCDHNLSVGQLDFITKRFADRKEFFIETFELPEELGNVEVSLYGPATGKPPVVEDDVVYVIRGGRSCASRVHKRSESVLRDAQGLTGLSASADPAWAKEVEEEIAERRIALPVSRMVTVIAGPHTTCRNKGACTGAVCADYDTHTEHACVLYTAYGGPQAPREPGDLSIKSWEELEASRVFWSQHALVL